MQGVDRQHRVVAVIDHDADIDRLADALDVGEKTFLRRIDQVMRQQQDAIGACLLYGLRQFDADMGAEATAGDDGGRAGRFLGGLDDCRNFIGRQREELASAASCKSTGAS